MRVSLQSREDPKSPEKGRDRARQGQHSHSCACFPLAGEQQGAGGTRADALRATSRRCTRSGREVRGSCRGCQEPGTSVTIRGAAPPWSYMSGFQYALPTGAAVPWGGQLNPSGWATQILREVGAHYHRQSQHTLNKWRSVITSLMARCIVQVGPAALPASGSPSLTHCEPMPDPLQAVLG